jgi:DNA-binding transcriptional ArsR family regulator
MSENGDDFNASRAELFEALGHPTRIKIIQALRERPLGFSELKKEAGVDSNGLLAFHLGKLGHLVKTDKDGSHALTDEGREALRIVGTIRDEGAGGKAPKGFSVPKPCLRALLAILVVGLLVLGAVAVYQQEQIVGLHNSLTSIKSGSGELAPLGVLSNRITLFGGVGGSGYAGGPAIWSLSLRDNSNETIRLVAGLSSNSSGGGDYISATLSPGETYNNGSCLTASSSTYSSSIVWFTGSGLVNLTPAVEVVRATEVTYSNQLSLVSANLVASQYAANSNLTFSSLSVALKNTGTKPIALILVGLTVNGSQTIVAFPCANYGIVLTPENPLTSGQTATVETPLFRPSVTAGQTYQLTVVAGYLDGTEVNFSTTIQAK